MVNFLTVFSIIRKPIMIVADKVAENGIQKYFDESGAEYIKDELDPSFEEDIDGWVAEVETVSEMLFDMGYCCTIMTVAAALRVYDHKRKEFVDVDIVSGNPSILDQACAPLPSYKVDRMKTFSEVIACMSAINKQACTSTDPSEKRDQILCFYFAHDMPKGVHFVAYNSYCKTK